MSLANANLIRLLTMDLHQGEAEAIALAVEIKVDWLRIDEKEGRPRDPRLRRTWRPATKYSRQQRLQTEAGAQIAKSSS